MEISPAAKVGMILVLALIIMGLIFSELRGMKKEVGIEYCITFERVAGLLENAQVRMAGVTIGKVKMVEFLTGIREKKKNVRVTILVSEKGPKIPEDSEVSIGTSFLGDKWVEILPGTGAPLDPSKELVGRTPLTLDDMIDKGDRILLKAERAIDNFNEFAGDPRVKKDIKATVANFRVISTNLKNASKDIGEKISGLTAHTNKLVEHADELVVGLRNDTKNIGRDFSGVTSTLKRIATSSEKDIRAIVLNLHDASSNLNLSMKAVKDLVTKEQFSTDILKTLSSLRKTGEEVEAAASDIHSLTSDPELRESLKATIREARETVKGADKLIKKFDKILGEEGSAGSYLGLFELDSSMEWSTKTGIPAANINGYFLPRAPYNLKVGLDSVGDGNYQNFQVGKKMKGMHPRVGVVRSEFGVGLDAELGKNLGVSFDAYDTSDLHLDLLGNLRFGRDFYLLGGVRDALDEKRTVLGVGKRF